MHNLRFLILSHSLHVSFPTGNGCREKIVQIMCVYLIQANYLWRVLSLSSGQVLNLVGVELDQSTCANRNQ
jgi:hypothetical protein